jgi:hypothetical protein
MAKSDLVFSPAEALTIRVSEHDTAQTILRIKNHTTENIAFKVKTTTPERYLVKPNHGLIRQGRHAEITIIVVQTKKKEILTKAILNGRIDCNDKFLIQSAGVDELLTDNLESKTSHELTDAITLLLGNVDKRKLRAKKLTVEMQVVDLPAKGLDTCARDEDCLLLQQPIETTATISTSGSPEAMFAEVVALRKKYDDLVAFTVNLTAERDSLSANLASTRSSNSGQDSFLVRSNSEELIESKINRLKGCSLRGVVLLCSMSYVLGWCTAGYLDLNQG